VLKLGVRFPSGKWQSEWGWGLRFRFGFCFGHGIGLMVCWLWGSGNTLAVVGCFGYVVGWFGMCGKGWYHFEKIGALMGFILNILDLGLN